jgi:hypothetical protein
VEPWLEGDYREQKVMAFTKKTKVSKEVVRVAPPKEKKDKDKPPHPRVKREDGREEAWFGCGWRGW